eukprot:840757-Amphidinium_carterae.1
MNKDHTFVSEQLVLGDERPRGVDGLTQLELVCVPLSRRPNGEIGKWRNYEFLNLAVCSAAAP